MQRYRFARSNVGVENADGFVLKKQSMMLWRSAQSIKLFWPLIRFLRHCIGAIT
jgi:hypothetical protein